MMRPNTILSKITIIGSILFLGFLLSISANASNGKIVSDTITLSPLEQHVVSFKLHEDDTLTISISVTSGEIDLLILDSENYPTIVYYEEYYSGISSTFNTDFEPLWSDTFYVMFENVDVSISATFSFTLESDQEFSTNLIINLSLGAGLLGAIIVVNFTGKKAK